MMEEEFVVNIEPTVHKVLEFEMKPFVHNQLDHQPKGLNNESNRIDDEKTKTSLTENFCLNQTALSITMNSKNSQIIQT